MIIKSFELFKFQIPLKYPLKIKNDQINYREGLILKIFDEKKIIGFGEISPLPGLHKETYKQTLVQIRKILPKLLNIEIPLNFISSDNDMDILLKKFELYPSVQFGLESAFISLHAGETNISIFDFFNASSNKSIEINALLSGSHDQILKKTKQYLKDGFTVFKLKVGRKKIEDEIDLVNRINDIIVGKAQLRLDANQAWNLKDTLHFFQNIDKTNLEYIEEPLKNFGELPSLLSHSSIPIAFDENVLNIYKMPELYLSKIKAIIIKPTVIGGIQKSLKLIRFADQNGITSVISDTFQTGIGLSTLIAIGHLIHSEIPMGFDTYSWLKQDIWQNDFKINQGKLFYNKTKISDNNLNLSMLQKI